MKKITKDDLPEVLTDEIENILVDMALEFPQSKEWQEIFDILDERGQLIKVLEKVRLKRKEIEQKSENSKSEEQKVKEKKDWEEFLKNVDPKNFYGNMGEPQTPEEYKNKYGTWPPGYDEKGNRI